MPTAPLTIGLIALSALMAVLFVLVAVLDHYRRRQISELREQLQPFADIVAEAITLFEARKRQHNVMNEIKAENDLIAKVRVL